MKIILLKDVAKLGRRFDVKEVASGHALNLLIPRGEAIAATPAALKKYESERARMDSERKVQEDLIAKNLRDLEKLTLTVEGKASDKGHLFAGIHKDIISSELKKQLKLEISPEFIHLDQPIKEVGEHFIEVKSGSKMAKFKLIVNPL